MSTLVDIGLVAKGGLATLAMMAVQGTVLAVAALALTRVGRLRPTWQAAIWLVVTVKFVLPWGPAMPWSLSDLVAMLTSTDTQVAPLVLTESMIRVAPTYSAWPAVGWIMLASLWALGALVVITRIVLAQRGTLHAARTATPAPAAAQSLLDSLAARRIRFLVTAPRLVVGDADVGPHVVGMLRPIIVVPPALLDDTTLLRAVLLHELAHVRRRDAVARLVQVTASTLLWWWPIVRLVHRKLELAREAACDAWALEAGDVPRRAYARLLVRMASLRSHEHAHALAAPRSLDARIKAVLGPAATARMSIVQRLALVGWAVLALGGARTAAARGAPQVCTYTTAMAEALYSRFPDADMDGDGYLSRDEACDLQATLRREPEERSSRFSADAEAEIQTLLADPLCCNCTELDANASPAPVACQKDGADR